MVALQLPVAIDFQFERTRFPSQTRKSAFEYPNNQRAFLLPSNRSSFNGVLLSSKEGSFSMIHRTERNGVLLNSTIADFKIAPTLPQPSPTVEPLEFNEALENSRADTIDLPPRIHRCHFNHFEVVSAYQLIAGRALSIALDELAISA
eukprot:scaffold25899_cov37-Cyclotella_meneghiniana.AAC.2